MAELCETHKLALAPDGRCVLCRRPKLQMLAQSDDESLASRAFTALLGIGLLSAMAALAYAWTLPSSRESSAGQRALAMQQAQPEPTTAVAAAKRSPDAGVAELKKPGDAARAKTEGTHDADLAAQRAPRELERRHTTGKNVDPRLAAARREVEVTMYSAPWCFICDRARIFLAAREVQLIEYDVDRDPLAARKLAQVNPAASIPTFIVDNQVIVGFHPWGLEDAIDEAAQDHLCAADEHAAVCERPATTSAARTP